MKDKPASRTGVPGPKGRVILAALLLAAMGAGCGANEGTVPGTPEPTLAAATPGASPNVEAAITPEMKSKLSPDDQALLAQARARGDSEVVLLVAAERGRTQEVATAIERLGGTIRSQHDNLDYISASVPVDKVEAVAQLDGVQAANLDREIPVPDPRPDTR